MRFALLRSRNEESGGRRAAARRYVAVIGQVNGTDGHHEELEEWHVAD